MNDETFAFLVQRYAEGTLSVPERAALTAEVGVNAGRRAQFAHQVRLSLELGALLGGVTLLIFGAVLLGPTLKHVSWQIALYAGLSLTIVRMLPVRSRSFAAWSKKTFVASKACMGEARRG